MVRITDERWAKLGQLAKPNRAAVLNAFIAWFLREPGAKLPDRPGDDQPPAILPEPPDGTRLEFEHDTDVYAAWRDDASSAQAGWTTGDGGEVWCLYGESVPRTWAQMCADFGDALRDAVRLVPIAEDLPKRSGWPTQKLARKHARSAGRRPARGGSR